VLRMTMKRMKLLKASWYATAFITCAVRRTTRARVSDPPLLRGVPPGHGVTQQGALAALARPGRPIEPGRGPALPFPFPPRRRRRRRRRRTGERPGMKGMGLSGTSLSDAPRST
jgi:hypothetical protein